MKKLGGGLRVVELIDLILLHLATKNREAKSNIKEMFRYFQFDTKRIETSLNQHLQNLNPSTP